MLRIPSKHERMIHGLQASKPMLQAEFKMVRRGKLPRNLSSDCPVLRFLGSAASCHRQTSLKPQQPHVWARGEAKPYYSWQLRRVSHTLDGEVWRCSAHI
jgi:hypothetical protein